MAEDEVGVALDVGFGVDLVAGFGEDGVLVSNELAGVVSLVLLRALVLTISSFLFSILGGLFSVCAGRTYAGVGGKGKGNVSFTAGVLDVDVVHFEVLGVDAEGGGFVVVGDIAETEPAADGDHVGRVRRGVGGVAVNGQGTLERWDGDLLIVGARLDEDALGSSGRGGEGIDGLLDLGVGLATTDHESTRGRTGSSSGSLDLLRGCGQGKAQVE